MSFENFYLSSLHEENHENTTPIESCSALRNSLARLYFESLDKLSNASSNLILEQKLLDYSSMVDDKSNEAAIDNYSKLIESRLKGKVQTRHCSLWKSQLGSGSMDPLEVLKNNLKKSGHCNVAKNLPCKSDNITEKNIKLLLEKKDQSKISEIRNKFCKESIRTLNANYKAKNFNEKVVQQNAHIQNGNNMNKDFNFKPMPPKITQAIPNTASSSRKLPLTSQNNEQSAGKPVQSNESSGKSNGFFRTARSELMIQNKKKFGDNKQSYPQITENNTNKRSLGTTRSIQSKFIPPMAGNEVREEKCDVEDEVMQDERLKHIDPKMVELIMSEIIDSTASIGWDDIAGLEFAKSTIQEAVVWPLLRPDIFTGLRRPPKGMLLFGPPGTGKTLIGKCIASQCCATFFSISASSLTSKWIGDGEKMVRALFAVARCHQPAVVFIDEIDSLLTQRSDAEHEATRRIKTEFLVQLDGAATGDEDQLLVIGATNRPQELDEAARRRLVKRLYIPLPDLRARQLIIERLMRTERNSLSEGDITSIAVLADGFSGADMRSLCSEAALCPIRAIPLSQITNIQTDQVRPVNIDDFKKALTRVRPSVSGDDLEHYTKWDNTYGSGSSHL